MESFNFLNTGSHVDNTATFAASVTSNTLSISNSAANLSSVNQVSSLSFSEHLKNSIKPNENSVNDLASNQQLSDEQVSDLADTVITDIKQVIQQNTDGHISSAQASQALQKIANDLQLTGNNINDIKSLISEIEGADENTLENALESIQKLLAELKTDVASNEVNEISLEAAQNSNVDNTKLPDQTKDDELSVIDTKVNEVALTDAAEVIDFKENSYSLLETNIDEESQIDEQQYIPKTSNDDESLKALNIGLVDERSIDDIETIDKMIGENTLETKPLNSSSIEDEMIVDKTPEEILINNSIDDIDVNDNDVKDNDVKDKDVKDIDVKDIDVKDMSKLISDIEKEIIAIESAYNEKDTLAINDDLIVQIKTIFDDITQKAKSSELDSEELMSQIEVMESALYALNNDEVFDLRKTKIMELVSQLPAPQQQALLLHYQQQPINSADKNVISTNELLMTLEKSHDALNDTDNDAALDENVLIKSDVTAKPLNMLDTLDVTPSNKISKFESDIKNTVLEPAIETVLNNDASDAIDIDAMISQLESNFKNSGQTQAIVTDEVTAPTSRVEQQIAKELSQLQQATISKTTEIVPPKLALNDNAMAAQQLKEHLIMMSRGGINQAVLQLDPEELGAMSVRIAMQNDQMSVQFQVQNPQAKDMLEQAMNKLKESLEEQGIALNQSDVEQQDQQDGQSQSAQALVNEQLFENVDEEDDAQVLTMTLHKQSTNGIDYYA